jgi:hypothetical protein
MPYEIKNLIGQAYIIPTKGLMNTEAILYHITVASKPDELIETTRGQIPYRQWLEEERDRIIKKSGWPVDIYENTNTGEISLVHLRIAKR